MKAPAIELRRYYTVLTAEETDEVVRIVARLIVNYLKTSPDLPAEGRNQESEHERDREQPESR